MQHLSIYEAPYVAKILINTLNKLKQKYNMKRTHDMLIFDILCRNAYKVHLKYVYKVCWKRYFVRVFSILYACTFQYTLCVYISVYFVRVHFSIVYACTLQYTLCVYISVYFVHVHFSILCACTFQYTLCVYISVYCVRVNGAYYMHVLFNTSCKKSYIIINQYGSNEPTNY